MYWIVKIVASVYTRNHYLAINFNSVQNSFNTFQIWMLMDISFSYQIFCVLGKFTNNAKFTHKKQA